jgi:hypothetical protein
MVIPDNRSTYYALLISKITNPTIISVVVLLLLVFTKSVTTAEALIYIGLIFLLFAFIPVIYVMFRTSRNGQQPRSIGALTTFLKLHPVDILLLGVCLGVPCVVILFLLKAPNILMFTVLALLMGAIITSLCNLVYRVSFHLTGVTILIIIAAEAWGPWFLACFAVVPLIGWAKHRIGDHTVPQLLIGLTVGITVSLAVLHLI